MAKFVELTMPNGHAVLVNVNAIMWMTPTMPEGKATTGGNCCVSCGGDNIVYVVETAREILSLIEL